LLVEISCAADARRSVLRSFGEELRAALPEIIGVVVLRDGPAKKGTKQETLLSLGESSLSYRAGRAVYRVSAGAFFQTNRHLVDELVRIVTQGRSGELALDLYSGVGLFSTALGDFHHVVSVESSQTAAADLAYNIPETGEMVEATTEEFLNAGGKRGVKGGLPGGKRDVRIQSDRKPDLVVVDPPRSGLGERVTRALASLGAPRVTYVSCDPATLARDLVTLVAAGYRVDEAHLVDLFPQTYHLESVLQLVR